MTVPLTKPSIKEPETLIDAEIHMIKQTAKKENFRNFVMISLALSTGLRNNEICGLTVELIRCFSIVPTILSLPGTIAKGGTPREIHLKPDTRELLDQFLAWKDNFGEDTNPDSYLFVSQNAHNQLNPRDFQRIVSGISQRAIGRKIHPHVFRHTFATHLLRISNLQIVQIALGHKNIQTTTIYTHPSTNEISQAVNLISL